MHFAPILLTLAAVSAAPTKRANTCKFPTDAGLVAVTPNSKNAGWALSPDQECTSGSYCPYACPPGKVMAQWDPKSTSYTTSESQNGGLYCNDDGTVSKPFSDKAYCVEGTDTVSVNNKADSDVAFCQTVLPGNEAMLIPTNIGGGNTKKIAVPSADYWASTAAHYYVNAPGVSTDDGCVWGTKSKAQGNWAPYVAGTNTDESGKTFVKIGWNPKYIDDFTDKPDFGLRIICDEGKCDGLDCEIDPSKSGLNGIDGSSADEADGAKFCVVTAEKGASAKIEIFTV